MELKVPIWCLRALASVPGGLHFGLGVTLLLIASLMPQETVHLFLCREKFREAVTDTGVYLFVVVFHLGEGHINIKGQNILIPFNFFFSSFWLFPRVFNFHP